MRSVRGTPWSHRAPTGSHFGIRHVGHIINPVLELPYPGSRRLVDDLEAASRLGYSSGLCSFHLRQLARHGFIEEAPHSGGRARPWRLRQEVQPDGGPSRERFGDLARGLEDESWQRWLSQRDAAPAEWRHDEAWSAVAYLTPEEMRVIANTVRRALAPYKDREQRPLARPEHARPVALISRLFPLLPHTPDVAEQD